jgi:phosphoribosylformylglycinamidine (FGAM) synthase-like enzyme
MLAALAECCLLGNHGVRCPALRTEGDLRLDAGFFGETQARFVISAGSRAMPELQALARRMHVEFEMLGNVHSDRIVFEGQVDVDLAELRQDWERALL